jgi:hypothetical protein
VREAGLVIGLLWHVPRGDATVPRRGTRYAHDHRGFQDFTFVIRLAGRTWRNGTALEWSGTMDQMLYLHDRREVTDAAELIRAFGEDAGFEAAARADRSRELGNHLHFCRWRQIERLIVLMSVGRAVGTVH